MPPIEVIRIALAEYQDWRWQKIVGPVVDRFKKLSTKREIAKQRRRRVRDYDKSLVRLRVRQLQLEASL